MSINSQVPSIDVSGVTLTYGDATVLDDVSFSIQKGEYVALIGPNGAGKTTLLKLILGLIKPTGGTIKILGTDISAFNKKYLLGYIPQRISSTLFRFPANVEEVVRSGRTARIGLFKQYSPQDDKVVSWAMQIADIEAYRKKPVSELSGGELQRVFIARALSGEPKILLLDEPTVGVDLAAQEKFYAFLKELNKKLGLTILIVTHEVDVAVHRAQYVLCLNRKLICHIRSTLLLKGNYLEKLYGSHTHILRHGHYEET